MRKNVSEPWFSLIALGLKKVEGRLDKGDFSEAKAGVWVTWVNSDLGFERRVKTKITSVVKYPTFKKFLRGEGLQACLPAPGVKSIAKGVDVYKQFYDDAAEREHGVLALRIKLSGTGPK
jgi:ASC-1-like (ASCH) protein